MPLTDVEVSRLADAIHAARPDWPARSNRAFISAKMRGYAFADAFVALAVVAADPASETPARVLEPGPWWLATRANRPGGATPTPATPTCPIHPDQPPGSKACPDCERARVRPEHTPNLRALIAEEAS